MVLAFVALCTISGDGWGTFLVPEGEGGGNFPDEK